MAGIDEARLAPRRRFAVRRAFAVATGLALAPALPAVERLERHRRHRPQHLDMMHAAVPAAELVAQDARPAAPDPLALERVKGGRDGGADLVGAGGGDALDLADDELLIQRQADAHVVQRLARRDGLAPIVGEGI